MSILFKKNFNWAIYECETIFRNDEISLFIKYFTAIEFFIHKFHVAMNEHCIHFPVGLSVSHFKS